MPALQTLRLAVPLLALLCACGHEAFSGTCGAAAARPARLLVRFDQPRQTIDGLGASTAFMDEALTEAQADLFFSPERGIGLSLLRLRVGEDGGLGGGDWSDAARAAARGARVWATPWSAPAAWKDNGREGDGGRLCARAGQGRCDADRYGDWAARLAGFSGLLRARAGVDLYALAAQNEPDMSPAYASMKMSPDEAAAFTKVLGPALAAAGPRPRLMLGEYGDWRWLPALMARITADPEALAQTDLFSAHQYSGVVAGGAPARPVWETEFSRFRDEFDPSMTMGVVAAHMIHEAFLHGGATAWHYWWLRNPVADDDQGLIGHAADGDALTKRLFAVGNFSRFVRPGWRRLEVEGGGPGVVASAYQDPERGAFAVVIEACASTGAVAVDVDVSGGGVEALEAWVTSATPLGALGADGNLSHGSLSAGIPGTVAAPGGRLRVTVPYGVTTFVGRPGSR